MKLQSFISAFILHTPSDVETEASRRCFSPIPTLRAIFPVKIKASTSSFPTLQSDRGGWRARGEPPYLEDVFAGSYVRNVDPLAVNVMAVGVPAANGDTLLSHVVAGEALLDTWKIQLESDKEETFCDFTRSSFLCIKCSIFNSYFLPMSVCVDFAISNRGFNFLPPA